MRLLVIFLAALAANATAIPTSPPPSDAEDKDPWKGLTGLKDYVNRQGNCKGLFNSRTLLEAHDYCNKEVCTPDAKHACPNSKTEVPPVPGKALCDTNTFAAKMGLADCICYYDFSKCPPAPPCDWKCQFDRFVKDYMPM